MSMPLRTKAEVEALLEGLKQAYQTLPQLERDEVKLALQAAINPTEAIYEEVNAGRFGRSSLVNM